MKAKAAAPYALAALAGGYGASEGLEAGELRAEVSTLEAKYDGCREGEPAWLGYCRVSRVRCYLGSDRTVYGDVCGEDGPCEATFPTRAGR